MNSSLAARGREPRRRLPVDRLDVVAGLVRARAGDVGALARAARS